MEQQVKTERRVHTRIFNVEHYTCMHKKHTVRSFELILFNLMLV